MGDAMHGVRRVIIWPVAGECRQKNTRRAARGGRLSDGDSAC